MFRKYPMCVLENWVAADDSDFQLSTEPKQMAFEFEVADFTECHHTQWSSNNMVFRRGTASSVDMSVEDVTITSFSRSGVQGTCPNHHYCTELNDEKCDKGTQCSFYDPSKQNSQTEGENWMSKFHEKIFKTVRKSYAKAKS